MSTVDFTLKRWSLNMDLKRWSIRILWSLSGISQNLGSFRTRRKRASPPCCWRDHMLPARTPAGAT